jgi:hypothetical protein
MCQNHIWKVGKKAKNSPKKEEHCKGLWPISSSKHAPHPQEDLAKFGYRPEMKVENFNNPSIFWLPIIKIWLF